MKGVRSIYIFLVAVAVATSCQTKDPVQGDALTVNRDNSTEMKERRAQTAEMRGFLWTHWIRHREAKLLIAEVTKEGQSTQSEYKIAILAGDVRVLRVTFKRGEHRISGIRIPRSEGGYDAYALERVVSKNPHGIGEEANVTPVSEDATMPSTDYWLRIKESDGKVYYF